MNYQNENNILTIAFADRIDSNNAAAIENEINGILENNEFQQLIGDFEETNYVSSAGLRVLLRLRKKVNNFSIINVCNDVYDVFSMTGFSEMMPISKAYRKVSIEGCDVIGQGANGKVYRISEDTIVKVYYDIDALEDIKRERELAKCAFVLGIPTAIPYDVVKVGDKYGSVFELLSAKSICKYILEDKNNADKYIGIYIDLLKKIHNTDVKDYDLPDMKQIAYDWAQFLADYLPVETENKLLSMIESVEDVNNMIHGDYHIKNVMIQDGESMLIDMDTLAKGHPIFELASVFNAYVGFSELDEQIIKDFLGIDHNMAHYIWHKSLELYLDTTDDKRVEEVAKKASLIGYTRLMRRRIRRNGLNEEEGIKEINNYKNHIIQLVEELDSLEF